VTDPAAPRHTAIDPTTGLAIVTGGTRGIGRVLAHGLAAAGHPVLLTGRSERAAQEAAGEIARRVSHDDAARATARVEGTALDVTDPESVAALAATAQALGARWGTPLRTLVNNAGLVEATEGPLWEADADDLAGVIDTNLTGVVRVLHALVPALLRTAEQTGEPVRIIDLNSGSGAHGTPAHAVYAASKAGLFRIAESLVVHGHDRGLRVFEMAPGVVESDMTRSMPMHDHRTGADWTDPQEVADLAVGLASGLLDGWTGRYVRAGVDTPQSLADAQPALVSGEAGEDFRRLALRMH